MARCQASKVDKLDASDAKLKDVRAVGFILYPAGADTIRLSSQVSNELGKETTGLCAFL